MPQVQLPLTPTSHMATYAVAALKNRTQTSIIILGFSPPPQKKIPVLLTTLDLLTRSMLMHMCEQLHCTSNVYHTEQIIQTSQIIRILKEKWVWAWHNCFLPRVTCTGTRP